MQQLTKEFLEQELAVKTARQVAEEQNTYPNKIIRLARKFNIAIKDKSESQKLAVKTGRLKPPMLGKTHKNETKNKISEQRHNAWETQKESPDYEELVQKHRDAFLNRDKDEITEMHKKAAKAIRATRKDGSKLERFLMNSLRDAGYSPEFHVKDALSQQDLEIDIYLPELMVAIEVDGVTHDENIYGEDHLNKRRYADSKKNGLLLVNGFTIIRIANKAKHVSKYFLNETWKKLESTLETIKEESPEPSIITF